MNEAYVHKVLIYLQQEMPERRGQIRAIGGKLIVDIPVTEEFQPAFDHFQQSATNSINRIRNREIDLQFTIKSGLEEREFMILK